MRIAVTFENGQIFQHFGHTEQFKIYDVEDGKVVSSQVAGTDGQGHGALAGVLKALGADVLICGGIGGGARAALDAGGIKLYGGVSGSADEAVEAFIPAGCPTIRRRGVTTTAITGRSTPAAITAEGIHAVTTADRDRAVTTGSRGREMSGCPGAGVTAA